MSQAKKPYSGSGAPPPAASMTTIPGRHVLMIDNYDSFTWNLYQFLCQLPRCGKVSVFRNDQIDIAAIERDIHPDIIFILPGPGHPKTDLGVLRDVIRHFKGRLPIFGVCMGLQCMFEVFGGVVDYAGEIVHGKTTTIRHDGRGMFAQVPQLVAVTRYHSLAGTLTTLPLCLEVTATTESLPLVIMGVRHKTYAIEGVQFHPESILTESGQMMIDNLLEVEGGYWPAAAPAASAGAAPAAAEPAAAGILARIYAQRQRDYAAIEALPGRSLAHLETTLSLEVAPPLIDFYQRLAGRTAILGEFKRASPSKGDIGDAHPGVQALTYARGGCAAVSVLTEPTWFKGSLDDMRLVRRVVEGPNRPAVLRKDFVFSCYQVLEARLAGADTVLLIVKMLNRELLQRLYAYSHSLGMVPLVEVNNAAELATALALGAAEPLVIGVNNRNLQTFDVDLDTTTLLVQQAKLAARPVLVLALSGIASVDDVRRYQRSVDGFLIGESLMRGGAALLGELQRVVD